MNQIDAADAVNRTLLIIAILQNHADQFPKLFAEIKALSIDAVVIADKFCCAVCRYDATSVTGMLDRALQDGDSLMVIDITDGVCASGTAPSELLAGVWKQLDLRWLA